ncbi:MAG: hypothetical protein IJ000_02045 [Paludibacteraceae bacterium]|nr:hypothetical protein [Paludibacteraceae bacterium]
MKNLRNLICAVLLFSSAFLMAEDKDCDAYRHSFRIGWGTAFSGKLMTDLSSRSSVPYYNNTYLQAIQGMTADEAHAYLTNYRIRSSSSTTVSSGHIFASYAYQFTPLVSFGVEADAVFLKNQFQMINGYGEHLKDPAISSLYHISLLPTVRFTYMRDGFISLYSSVGLGTTYSGYSSNLPSEWTEQSPANVGITANIALCGMNMHYHNWYAEAEVGLMATKMLLWPQSSHPILTSRLLSLAVGYRF